MPWFYPTPQVDPQAHRTVEVVGVLPTGVAAKVFASYRTTSSSVGCVKRGFFIEGVDTPLETTVDARTESAGPQFTASIQVDRYLPGRCGWMLADVWADLSASGINASHVHIGMSDQYWDRAIMAYDRGRRVQIDRSKLEPETVVRESASPAAPKFVGATGGSEYLPEVFNLGYEFLPQRIYADTATIRFRVMAAKVP